MEEKIIKILFAGNASAVASEISLELHNFFEGEKTSMKIEHIFTGWEVFKKIDEGISDFDIVVFDKKLKMMDFFMKIFAPEGHSFILLFFDSSKNEGKEKKDFLEEYLNIIKKHFLKS